jgi:hypothetical protein
MPIKRLTQEEGALHHRNHRGPGTDPQRLHGPRSTPAVALRGDSSETTGKIALETALKIVGQGMSNVIVTDLSGRSYSVAEPPLLLNECGKFDA